MDTEDTELTDVSSRKIANSRSTEFPQVNQRKDPVVELFNSLQVVSGVECISSDVLNERIQDTASEVDYSKIIDESSRVLFFGESHSELEPKLEIARSLRDLKRMGYAAVAMEFVGTDKQDLLDRYIEPGDYNDRQELRKYLEKLVGTYYGNLVAFSYMNLLDSVRYDKLAGVAIGTIFQDNDPESMIHNRDERLTDPLLKYLGENETNKAIVVTGAAHASKTFSNNMVGILQANGIHTQSIGLLGEEDRVPNDYVKAIHNVGLSRRRVMVPNPGAILARLEVDIPLSFDYLVHVPHPDFSPFR